MQQIPPGIYHHLCQMLARCGPFDSVCALRDVFVDGRIAPWRDKVPETAANKAERVRATIGALWDQYTPQRDNALALFLQVLSDLEDPGNVCQRDLTELAHTLQQPDNGDRAEGLRLSSPMEPAPLSAPHGDQFYMSSDFRNAAINIKSPIAGESTRRPPLQRPPRAEHFKGRKQVLAKLLTDLQPGRVVALCGPGGIGNSALAAEAIWTLAPGDKLPDRFPDGILLYSFYGKPDPALALEHIARSFGEEPRPTPTEAALRALAGKHALLILDGAEEACDLQAVLKVRGDCGVLITSRRRSDAPSYEQRQDIPALDTPDAVSLLRAFGGALVGEEAVAIEICERVSRLPLAVRLIGRYLSAAEEPAAEYLTWLRETPIQAMSQGEHKEENVALLLDRSLEPLSERACQILALTGVLALAPFGRAAIAAALDTMPNQLRRPLGELVNYGLLKREGTRYEVSHALLHTYARKRLSLEAESVVRMAAHYTALAETESTRGLPGYRRLDTERGHILRVLETCAAREEWETMRKLAAAVNGYLDTQGHWAERVQVLKSGFQAAQALEHRRDEGAFLGNLGLAHTALGQMREAITYHEQALAIARNINDRHMEGSSLGNLGTVYYSLGQVQEAIVYRKRALRITSDIGDRQGEGINLGALGGAYAFLGQVQKAIEYYEQVLTIASDISDCHMEENALSALGLAYTDLGQVQKAIKYHKKALAIARNMGDRRGEGASLGNLGAAYYYLGQTQEAIATYEQALAIAHDLGDRQGTSNHLGNLGSAYADLGQIQKAITYYEQALAIARDINDRRGEGNWLGNLGNIYVSLGQAEEAITYYKQALDIDREICYRRGEGADLSGLGSTYASLDQVQEAIAAYEQALAIDREIGDRRGEGINLHNLGELYKDQGNVSKARQYLQQALAIFEEIQSSYAEHARYLLDKFD